MQECAFIYPYVVQLFVEQMCNRVQLLGVCYPFFMEMGIVIAARPDLNREGMISLHPVGPRGGVDYGRCLEKVPRICLKEAVPHVSRSALRIHGGSHKFPCASLVGVVSRGFDKGDRLMYDPRIDPLGFWLGGSEWAGPGNVVLEGWKAWEGLPMDGAGR